MIFSQKYIRSPMLTYLIMGDTNYGHLLMLNPAKSQLWS